MRFTDCPGNLRDRLANRVASLESPGIYVLDAVGNGDEGQAIASCECVPGDHLHRLRHHDFSRLEGRTPLKSLQPLVVEDSIDGDEVPIVRWVGGRKAFAASHVAS